jgi:hypothetical protein
MMPSTRLHPLFLDPQAYPIVRPQLARVDHEVYFGRHPVARVTELEARFLEACSGTRTLAQAARVSRTDARCAARVSPWLIWLDRPAAASVAPSCDGTSIVPSASPVGAWLGMSGRLLQESTDRTTIVVTCFGSVAASHVPQAFATASEATMACRDEADLLARVSGVQAMAWDFPDADLRASMQSDGDTDIALAEGLRACVAALLTRHMPTHVFAPAALGTSPDGRLLFDTVLGLYADGTLASELHFYEDAPATRGYRQVDEFVGRFEGAYFEPREYCVGIDEALSRKSALIDALRCSVSAQDRRQWLQSGQLNALAWGRDGVRHAERFWMLDVRGIE